MSRRVVITGMGAITPIGNTVDEFWDNVKKGVVGIGPMTQIDTTDYKESPRRSGNLGACASAASQGKTLRPRHRAGERMNG